MWQEGPTGSTEVQDGVAVAVEADLAHRQECAALARPCATAAWRDRLQKVACAGARVARSASALAQANMRTTPVSASWAIAGTRPIASNFTAASRASAAPPGRSLPGRSRLFCPRGMRRTGTPRARR